ncbi:MAG TPA: molybdopterin-dependent oxidoreductase [Candidatus Eisenbacteria bacterium]|nr:molybdopterin-dependent oxidoreductase [Candidatus Eisenbacteria bacterium]
MTEQRLPRWPAAFAGVVAVGAAIATGELAAGVVAGVPSPVLSIGRLIVDLQPAGAKDIVVAIFGTNDKLALEVFVTLVALAIGAALGLLALRRLGLAAGVIAAFAVAGLIASLRDPDVSPAFAALAAGAEAVVGTIVLRRLLALTPASGTEASPDPRRGMPDWTRRRLLIQGGGLAVGSVAAAAFGRSLLEGQRAPVASAPLPDAPKPVVLPAGADLGLAGLTPIVVPNEQFYRIDTALIPPNVDVATWKLRVFGLVDREVELTYAELIQLPIVEQYTTIACVSNEVGGDLVGNAAWRGVPLRTVLDLAGVHANASQLVGRSIDGFTAGMPTAWVMDESRVPLIAVGMNGAPLPRAHGYPARLVVPGLYGYVSATKWLTELELTTLAAFDGFWIPRGWAKEAPILTQSRIDLPRDGTAQAGTVPIAGVAWAPDRGIARVEVAVDGEWREARISTPISSATWVQWRYDWAAIAGQHTIEVRATDGTGEVQTADHSPPAPDGARGHHTIRVTVS